MKRFLSMLLVLALVIGAVAVLASCGKDPVDPTPSEHTHEYGAWVADGALKHKKTCACGEVVTADHNFQTQEGTNANGMVVTKCTDCGFETYAYPWETETQLTMWISDNYQSGELLSGNRAFVAGQAYDAEVYTRNSLRVDDSNLINAVVARNNAAEAATKTTIRYIWNDALGWGAQMGEINDQISGGKGYDMYCGFIYDLVGVELNKNFANIANSPYFTFNHEDYDASKDEQGYFWDFMESLAFSTKGKFLVASNYMVDIVRAYFVTPVSIKLLKKTGLTTDQFIELVNTNKYTWSLITDMTNGNADKGITGVGTAGVNGNEFKETNEGALWGLTLANGSKLPIAGVCYANDFSIIERTVKDGEYVYTYNDSSDFAAMAASLKNSIGSSEYILNVGGKSWNSNDGDTVCVQKAFNAQRVLVGGVIVLGSIEDANYRGMWDAENGKEGFIVTPMPLYNEGDGYRTVIHNIGKVIGIAKNTSNLDRCAAYVDYCSTNSADILNDYYDWSLAMGAAGVFEENVAIIQEMRSRLVCTIDKIVDDAISLTSMKGTVGTEEKTLNGQYRFHDMLQRYYVSLGDGISAKYNEVKEAKQAAVNKLQETFREACTPAAPVAE